MDYDITILFDDIVASWMSFYHSPIFLFLKIILGIYLAVVFADIVLLLILRDVPGHYRTGVKGANIPIVSKSKMQKRWNKVKERIKSDNPSQYKVAIIEADAIAEEILGGIGYGGENMSQKLEQVGEMHLDEHSQTLAEVHKLRNRIVHEADFEIDQEMASAAVQVYENFLKYLEFLG